MNEMIIYIVGGVVVLGAFIWISLCNRCKGDNCFKKQDKKGKLDTRANTNPIKHDGKKT